MKPVYESIANDEIKVGDIVAVCAAKVTGIAPHYTGTGQVYTLNGVGGVMLEDDESIKAAFRQLPPERNPDVLMRALENAVDAMTPFYDERDTDIKAALSRWIDEAKEELESEGRE